MPSRPHGARRGATAFSSADVAIDHVAIHLPGRASQVAPVDLAEPHGREPRRTSSLRVVWLSRLLGDPVLEIGAAVDDAATESEAAGFGAEVAPVAQRLPGRG